MACDQFPDIFEHPVAGATPDEIKAVGARNDKSQALYSAVRFLLTGRFNVPLESLPETTQALEPLGTTAVFPFFISVYGLLLADNFTDPTLSKTTFGPDDIRTNIKIPRPSGGPDPLQPLNIARRFVDEMIAVVSEFQASDELFSSVYSILRQLGAGTVVGTASSSGQATSTTMATTAARRARTVRADMPSEGSSGSGTPSGSGSGSAGGTDDDSSGVTVFARQVAEVTRRLVEENTLSTDPQLSVRVSSLLSVVLGDSVGGRASAIDVSLPDLEEETVASVIPDNVISCAPLYMAAMLEDYKFFAAADYVANDLFMQGMLPLSRGPGGNALYEYIRSAPNRFTVSERRTIYAQVLGLAQGSVDVQLPNREFSDLWIRFLSAVSLNNRQTALTNSRLVTTGSLVTPEQVFKAGKDLAVNLSLHGYGIGYFAAIELQKLINTVKDMLSFNDIISAFGTKDVWQLVERVSQLYLGGAVNGVRQRTMAQTGANIIKFLAKNAAVLSGQLVNLNTADINSDVERWLAVTGTDDNMVDKYSAPVAVSQQPTIPMTFGASQGMDLVRNALQQVGGITSGMLPNLGTNGVAMPKA